MGTEKYRLKWSKFETNILSAFQNLYETEQLSDVTLFCEGTTFKAHRLVLAACSSHFQNLFSNAPVTATHTQLFVILDGTRADDLQILLQFMYKGEAYLHEDRIDSVIRTAELLQIKGLCESPKNIVLNDNANLRGTSSIGGGGGSGAGSPASNAYMSGNPHEPSSHHHRPTVGIMGNRMIRKEQREPSHIRSSELHRDLERANLHRQSSLSDNDGPPPHPHSSRGMSPPPDQHHGFAFPTSRSAGPSAGPNDNTYGMYGRGFTAASNLSQFSGGGGSNRDYSPSDGRERSPPRQRSYGSASSAPTISSDINKLVLKEDYDYDHRGPGPPGSRSGSIGIHDRGTPASDKTMDRHTPASHHGGNERHSERDYDQRGSSRNSPPSAVTPPSKFPASDSTTDYTKAASSSTFKSERIRSTSDSTGAVVSGGPGIEAIDAAEARAKFQLQDYRVGRGEPPDQTGVRPRSPRSPATVRSSGISDQTRITTNDEASRQQVANLEAFRRIAQAQAEQAERERFLPGAAGVLHGGINAAATIAAQGLTGTSASDLMRLAVPVRDPENGDTISGSGSKLKCPFCERTYGYETNLRAHIRQRHQGIRVSCPYCPRTFTRNNTVRRHVAREHRNMPTSRIPAKFGSTRVMPDPIRGAVVGQLVSAISASSANAIGARNAGLQVAAGLGALNVQNLPPLPDGIADNNGGVISPIPATSAP